MVTTEQITKNKSIKCLLVIALVGLISTTATAENIYLEIKQIGKFEVLYDRAKSTATGAVIGGLIGAAVEDSIRNDKDKKKEADVLRHLENPACEGPIISALREKLLSKGKILEVVETSHKNVGMHLKLSVKSCGFKLVDATLHEVAAYADLRAKLYVDGDLDPDFEKRFYLTSKNQQPFPTLLSESEYIEAEFLSALERAGKRLANKLIYRKGN